MLHGEIEGVLPADRRAVEYGGAIVGLRELGAEEWSYVALGHYHVQHEVAPRRLVRRRAGVLEPQHLGRAARTRRRTAIRGKGWLLVDLDDGT